MSAPENAAHTPGRVKYGVLPTPLWTVNLPGIRGVFVGGCVDRGVGSKFRALSHAHTSESGPNYRWICFRSDRCLGMREVWLHEIAHLHTGSGHTDKWRSKVLELGGTLDPVPGAMRDYNAKARRGAK